MQKILIVSALGLILALAAVAQPEAHHAFGAEFDANDPITLDGTVVLMEWVNPHAWLTIEVPNADGDVEQWQLEFGPPNQLFRRGWRKSSLMPGMQVKATGFRATDGRNVANADEVTLPDGRTFGAGTAGSGAPTDPAR